MAIDFKKFDTEMNLNDLKNDIASAADGNNGERVEIPCGNYDVSIEKLELVVSKKGDPMVTCWMKILEGEYKDKMLFMNQVVTKGFQIHIVNKFLRDLVEGMDIAVEFESYSQYAELLLDISEEIDDAREYTVAYGEKNGFNTFEIKEVFDLD